MARIPVEVPEHDQLVSMMASYFKQMNFTDIRADIAGWQRPEGVFWTTNPNKMFFPDLTCFDSNGIQVILEAETCSTLRDPHTQDQFKIFSAHATNRGGRFEVVVPRLCSGEDARILISRIAKSWGVKLGNTWTPGK